MRYVVVGLIAAAGLGVSALAVPKPAPAPKEPTQKQVRLQNRSDIKVRIRCVGYEQDHNFTRDIPPAQFEMVSGVDTGPRVIVVYKQDGSAIVAQKEFLLDPSGKDADVVIRGNKANGYQIEVTNADL